MITNKNIKKILPEITQLNYEGNPYIINDDTLYISILGSRKASPYGIQACEHIVNILKEFTNIAIIAGGGYGLDGLTHTLAIKNDIPTICIPMSSIEDDYFYPRSHIDLKHEIIDHKGLILSEFSPQTRSSLWTAPVRNRLITGLSHIVIVIDVEPNTLHFSSVQMASELEKTIVAIPANCFQRNNGTNHLIQKYKEIITYTDDDDFRKTITDISLSNNIYIAK